MASDWLVQRGWNELRVRRNLIIFGLVVACLIVPAGLVGNKITAVWLLTLVVGGLSVAAPMAWTLTQAVCDKRIVGTATGLQNFSGNLGGILSPVLTGFIAHATGSFALALCVAGAILIAGMVAYGLLVNERIVLPYADNMSTQDLTK